MQFEEYRKLQQETAIEDLKVSYAVLGEGTPLLLIHGIPVWGYLWKDCIETLSQHFRLVIPDLVGYGYSDQRDCFDLSWPKNVIHSGICWSFRIARKILCMRA